MNIRLILYINILNNNCFNSKIINSKKQNFVYPTKKNKDSQKKKKKNNFIKKNIFWIKIIIPIFGIGFLFILFFKKETEQEKEERIKKETEKKQQKKEKIINLIKDFIKNDFIEDADSFDKSTEKYLYLFIDLNLIQIKKSNNFLKYLDELFPIFDNDIDMPYVEYLYKCDSDFKSNNKEKYLNQFKKKLKENQKTYLFISFYIPLKDLNILGNYLDYNDFIKNIDNPNYLIISTKYLNNQGKEKNKNILNTLIKECCN